MPDRRPRNQMIAAIYVPIWVIPTICEGLLVAYFVWDGYQARRQRRRRRERIRENRVRS